MADFRTAPASRFEIAIACLVVSCSSGSSKLPDSQEPPPGPPSVAFDSGSSTVSESAGTTAVTVSMSKTATADVEVTFDLGGSAEDPEDYTVVTTPLVIPAGELSADIELSIVPDSSCEGDETIDITLTGATGADLGSAITHEVTITDEPFEESEPNDLPGEANLVTDDLTPATACLVTGSIEAIGSGDNFDVFAFEATEATLVSMQLAPAGAADLVLWVTGVSGTLLEEIDDAGPGGTESGQYSVVLVAPDFHLVVWSKSGSGDYELQVTGSAPVDAGGGLGAPRVVSEVRTVVSHPGTGRLRVLVEREMGSGQ